MQLCQVCTWRMRRERSWLRDGCIHRKHHARISHIKSNPWVRLALTEDQRIGNPLLRAVTVTDYHQPWGRISCLMPVTGMPNTVLRGTVPRPNGARSTSLWTIFHSLPTTPFFRYSCFTFYILHHLKKIQVLLKTLKTPAFMVSLILKFSF